MAKINNYYGNQKDSFFKKAEGLKDKNTQAYQDTLAMSKFKLENSLQYLVHPLNEIGNPAAELWTDDLLEAPSFTDEYLAYWSPNEYAQYVQRVEKWAHEYTRPFTLKLNLRSMLMRERYSYQFEAINRMMNHLIHDPDFLVSHQDNVQQLCDEIGEAPWIGFAEYNAKDTKKLTNGFAKLKHYSLAMRHHDEHLANDKLTHHKLEIVNLTDLAKEAARTVDEDIGSLDNGLDNLKGKDNGLEL